MASGSTAPRRRRALNRVRIFPGNSAAHSKNNSVKPAGRVMPDDTKLINLYGSTNMTPPRSPVPGGSGAANEALATVFLASLVSDLALVKVQIGDINRALACRAELDRDIAASFESIRGHLRDQV